MRTNENETTLIESQKEKDAQKFLLEVKSLIAESKDVDDPKVKEAVRQLQEIKADLEGNLEYRKQTPRDWVAIANNLFMAGRWIKIIFDFIQQ